jgi:hypothetical protein
MYKRNHYVFKNFWGLTASILGTYEAISFLSGKRTPTLSSFCARRRSTRIMLVAWTLGLAQHIWRHQV